MLLCKNDKVGNLIEHYKVLLRRHLTRLKQDIRMMNTSYEKNNKIF